MIPISLILFAYFLGSISSAVVICKFFRLPDPRTQGSNNPGATNVLRIGGRLPALLTLLGDALKAVIPVLVLKAFGFSPVWQLAGLSAAFIGHLFPCFFCFRGGKGVATLLGGLWAFSWPLGAGFVGTWLLAVAIFRVSALGAICASLLTPVFAYGLTADPVIVLILTGLVLLLLWRHKSNIQGLFKSGQKNQS